MSTPRNLTSVLNVPNYVNELAVDDQRNFTDPWQQFFSQLQHYMQTNLGSEGYKIPIISSDPASVSPSTVGGQVAQLQASFGQQPGVRGAGVTAGTLIFDPYEVNGATPPARNGQLKILLADGLFHKVTNT